MDTKEWYLDLIYWVASDPVVRFYTLRKFFNQISPIVNICLSSFLRNQKIFSLKEVLTDCGETYLDSKHWTAYDPVVSVEKLNEFIIEISKTLIQSVFVDFDQ